MEKVTTLRNATQANDYVRPLRILSSIPYQVPDTDWVYNSVTLIFPAKRSDGKPIIETSTGRIELRTQVDRREVAIQINY